MKKAYSDEDLIRFIYDEMTKAEADALLAAMVKDESLWARFEGLQETTELVKTVEMEPSEESLEAVRSYVRSSKAEFVKKARELAIQKFKLKAGRFSVNLNAVMALSLGVFITLGVIGSAYKLTRSQFVSPDQGSMVQGFEQGEVAPAEVYDWETPELNQQLRQLREDIESFREES